MKIGIAQVNSRVGDFPGNAKRILQAYRACMDVGAELVVTPEMSLVGYPPRDLLRKARFIEKCLQALDYLASEVGEVPLIVGYVDHFADDYPGRALRNAAAFLHERKVAHKVWKTLLPSYDLFDEASYFEPASDCRPIEFKGKKIGLTICEDIWAEGYRERPEYERDPVAELKEQGIDLLINISASPFHRGKPQQRADQLEVVASGVRVPLVYCNAVGANDQMVFDGHSMVLDAEGNEIANMPGFQACTKLIDTNLRGVSGPKARGQNLADVHDALVMGLTDYVEKSGFDTVCLALDGGVDAALVACLAVQAVGPKRVHALIMPTEGMCEARVSDAQMVAANLGIACQTLPLQETQHAAGRALHSLFQEDISDVTAANMASRLRGMVLNSYANQQRHLVISSGNKTDLTLGDFTVYGDLHAGLAILSDVPKFLVVELARWLNSKNKIMPEPMFTRDTSPTYGGLPLGITYLALDEILWLYVDQCQPSDEIVQRFDHDEVLVRWVQRKVDLNEWKRQQLPPGIRVTSRAFGMQRRIPLGQCFVD